MATPTGSGIGGYDLLSAADQVFAYDGDGTGKLDHLVCYRPGTGIIQIFKKPSYGDIFVAVYPGGGIGGCGGTATAPQLRTFESLNTRPFESRRISLR